jgi:hypothetical protein
MVQCDGQRVGGAFLIELHQPSRRDRRAGRVDV